MRYIKTKDNIYEITDKQYDVLCGNLTDEEKEYYKNTVALGMGSIEEGNYKSIPIKDIIAKADTIEELCDGFYLDDGQEEFCLDDVFTNFDKFKSSCIYNNKYHIVKYEGYGFIKTSKGLIYVAKMNDEGKLCLI